VYDIACNEEVNFVCGKMPAVAIHVDKWPMNLNTMTPEPRDSRIPPFHSRSCVVKTSFFTFHPFSKAKEAFL
jgi:hypothetical protein